MGIESPCGIRRCEVGYQPPLSLHVKNRPDFQAGFFFCSTIPPREKRLLEQKVGPRIDALNKIPMLESKAVRNGASFSRNRNGESFQFTPGSSGASESRWRKGPECRMIFFHASSGSFISISSRVGDMTSHVLPSISCSSWPGDQPEQPSKILRPLSHPSLEDSWSGSRNARKATIVGFSRH